MLVVHPKKTVASLEGIFCMKDSLTTFDEKRQQCTLLGGGPRNKAEAIALSLQAIGTRLEAIALGGHP